MAGLWATIIGQGKAGDAIDTGLGLIETAAKGLDKLIHTSEEKSDEFLALVDKNQAHAVAFAKMRQSESGASAVTRRLAMLIVLGNFTIFSVTGLALALMDKTALLLNLGKWAAIMMIGQLALTVVASIFGYYAWTKGKGAPTN